MQQVLAANKLKKIGKRKFSLANPLTKIFHYEGESPMMKRNTGGDSIFNSSIENKTHSYSWLLVQPAYTNCTLYKSTSVVRSTAS